MELHFIMPEQIIPFKFEKPPAVEIFDVQSVRSGQLGCVLSLDDATTIGQESLYMQIDGFGQILIDPVPSFYIILEVSVEIA